MVKLPTQPQPQPSINRFEYNRARGHATACCLIVQPFNSLRFQIYCDGGKKLALVHRDCRHGRQLHHTRPQREKASTSTWTWFARLCISADTHPVHYPCGCACTSTLGPTRLPLAVRNLRPLVPPLLNSRYCCGEAGLRTCCMCMSTCLCWCGLDQRVQESLALGVWLNNYQCCTWLLSVNMLHFIHHTMLA